MRIAKKSNNLAEENKLLGFKKLAEGARMLQVTVRCNSPKEESHQLWIPNTVGSSSRLRDSHSEVVLASWPQILPNPKVDALNPSLEFQSNCTNILPLSWVRLPTSHTGFMGCRDDPKQLPMLQYTHNNIQRINMVHGDEGSCKRRRGGEGLSRVRRRKQVKKSGQPAAAGAIQPMPTWEGIWETRLYVLTEWWMICDLKSRLRGGKVEVGCKARAPRVVWLAQKQAESRNWGSLLCYPPSSLPACLPACCLLTLTYCGDVSPSLVRNFSIQLYTYNLWSIQFHNSPTM
jgi:hypothetical protein